jgi:5-methyltetrahydropteroyltriglutamate--homocysteine methyltransferase
MTIPHLPARYDHVGSFLRPQYLLEAREKKATGQITAEQLRSVEDKAITEIVKFQEDVGLKSITDGEFRRTYFHIDFLEQLGGVKTDIPVTVRKPDGTEELAPPVIRVIDKVRHATDIQLADFQYLKSQVSAGRTPKVSIPSPTMLHFRGGRAGISKEAYPELDPAFYDDVARAYGDELRSLAAAGCTYVQMDDTNLAYLCDEKMREAARQRGDDPNELPHRYAQFVNKVVAQKPAGMTLAMHLCRGNFKSTHAAAGNYEPVAEALLKEMDIDAYFLEYDDDRSGDFRPLRLPAQRQDGGAGPGDHQVRHAGEQGRPQAPHRRGGPVRAAGPAGPVTAMRFQQHRARQQHRGRSPARQAAAGDRNGAGSLGRRLRVARGPHEAARSNSAI